VENLDIKVSIRKAAKELGVSPETLRRWEAEGKIRAGTAGTTWPAFADGPARSRNQCPGIQPRPESGSGEAGGATGDLLRRERVAVRSDPRPGFRVSGNSFAGSVPARSAGWWSPARIACFGSGRSWSSPCVSISGRRGSSSMPRKRRRSRKSWCRRCGKSSPCFWPGCTGAGAGRTGTF